MSEHEELPELVQCRMLGCTNLLLTPGGTLLPGSPVPVLICGTCLADFKRIPEELGLAFVVCLSCETTHYMFDPRKRNLTRYFGSLLQQKMTLSSLVYYASNCPLCNKDAHMSKIDVTPHIHYKHPGGQSHHDYE